MRKGSKLSEEHKRKLVSAGQRAHLVHRNKMAKMAQGADEIMRSNHTGATLDVSPAAWMPANKHVGDCEYMDDGLDDLLVRAVHDRVVYAGSVTCHHSTPFEDIAIATIAAAVRADPRRNGKEPKKGEVVTFTERQLKIIAMIAAGDTPKEIAEKLEISAKGVYMHTSVLRTKLGATSIRSIPAAYRHVTGMDPFEVVVATLPTFREELPLTKDDRAVEEPEEPITTDGDGFRVGRSLSDVVNDLFKEV